MATLVASPPSGPAQTTGLGHATLVLDVTALIEDGQLDQVPGPLDCEDRAPGGRADGGLEPRPLLYEGLLSAIAGFLGAQ